MKELSKTRFNFIFFTAIILLIFFDFIQLNLMHILSIQLLNYFNFSPTTLGSISSTYFYTDLFLIFFSGYILTYFPPVNVMCLSISICLLGILFFLIHPNIYTMILWRVSSGICGAITITGIMKISVEYFFRAKPVFIISIIGSISMLAGIVSQSPVFLLANILGWKATLILNLVSGIIIVILFFLSHQINMISDDKLKVSTSVKSLLKEKHNWLSAIFSCLINLPLFVLGALWGSYYLVNVFFISKTSAAFVITSMYVGYMIGSPLLSFISTQIQQRKFVLFFGAITYFFCIFILLLFPHLTYNNLISLFFLIGFAASVQPIVWSTVIENNIKFGLDSGISISFLSFISLLGGAIAQPLFGVLVDSNLNKILGLNHAMTMILMCSIVSIAILLVFPKWKHG